MRPLWQPWLGAVVLAAVISNAVAFSVYRTVPIEFFVVGSAVGALMGVFIARRIGWRTAWPMGAVVGVGIDMVAFVAASYWLSWALLHLGKVG